MKHPAHRTFWLFTLALLLMAAGCQRVPERDYYQLKIYTLDQRGQEERLDSYLGEAYLPALHRAGIENVGVFKSSEEADSSKGSVYVLIPCGSLGEMEGLQALLQEDVDFQEAGKDYIAAAHESPPYARIESILMRAFSETPLLQVPLLDSPRPGRVYELRSYQSATELLHERKVEMFNSGESALFEKLGFNPVFFGEVISGSDMPNLMYMIAFADSTSQKEHWNAFITHPEWEEMKGMERYQNTVSHIDRYLLYPTPYSDY